MANAEAYEVAAEDLFDRLYNTNVKGMYFSLQKALPYLTLVATFYSVLFIGGDLSFDGLNADGSIKAALRHFVKTCTKELKARKIRVNVLSPGPTREEFIREKF